MKMFNVGEGVRYSVGTDVYPATVLSVSKSGKQILLQDDKATLTTKMHFAPGGFAAHCTNNLDQEYLYEVDPDGRIHKATLRKDGSFRLVGMSSTGLVKPGRQRYHDYNF